MNKSYFTLLIIALSLNLRPAITAIGPLLTIIETDLAMGNVSGSLLTTLPVFFMGAASIFALYLSRKLQVEGALMVALSLIFIALLGRLVVSSSLGLILTALIAGMGIGIAGPLVIGLIKKYYPNEPNLMSFYSSAMVAGAAIASTFALPLFQAFNESWRMALSFWSLFSLLAAILLLPLLKKEASVSSVSSTTSKTTAPKNIGLMIFFALMAAIFYSLTAWLAPYVQSIGFSKASSGFLLSAFTLIQLPVSFIIPRLASTKEKTKKLLITCGMLDLIGLTLLLVRISPWFAVIFLAIGAGGLFPLALTLPLLSTNNAEEAIALSAFMQSGGYMIASLGPLLYGWISETTQSFDLAWIAVVILILFMLGTIQKIIKS